MPANLISCVVSRQGKGSDPAIRSSISHQTNPPFKRRFKDRRTPEGAVGGVVPFSAYRAIEVPDPGCVVVRYIEGRCPR